MKKFIVLFLLFLSISANPTYAKEFATSYIINYSIDENANTKVEYDI